MTDAKYAARVWRRSNLEPVAEREVEAMLRALAPKLGDCETHPMKIRQVDAEGSRGLVDHDQGDRPWKWVVYVGSYYAGGHTRGGALCRMLAHFLEGGPIFPGT